MPARRCHLGCSLAICSQTPASWRKRQGAGPAPRAPLYLKHALHTGLPFGGAAGVSVAPRASACGFLEGRGVSLASLGAHMAELSPTALGCQHSHRSESCKVNSCHNQGGGGQIASQSSFTVTLEDLDFHVSVGGFPFSADSECGGLSCSPTLVTGDQQQWPSQPRGRAQPGDQPSPLGSNLTQTCSTECKWFRRDAGPGLSARLFSASPGCSGASEARPLVRPVQDALEEGLGAPWRPGWPFLLSSGIPSGS